MSTGDLGKAEEQFKTIRRYGKNLNVYRVYDVEEPKVHYIMKKYDTKEEYEREKLILDKLSDAKNIMQMIEFYSSQEIIVCECALYHLETFLGHQNYVQRDKEKGNIIKDVVSGLSELQEHNIVHTELAPKNIMYFQEKGGFGSWKLIDFDAACFANRDRVTITTNYSAPEVIRADDKGIQIKAKFAMDMFSFGLILYFLETGDHYWDEDDFEDEEKREEREEMISENSSLPLHEVHDAGACFVINKLLDKIISRRMTLKEFMQTPYYTNKLMKGRGRRRRRRKGNTNRNNVENLQADYELCLHRTNSQEKFQDFLEKYNNEMKQSLKSMHDKIDKCTRTIENLSELTKKIPQWLIKVKNEVPRVFVMVPDKKKDWKKPETWLTSKPFRLLFVCEHKEQWHIPEQEGYKVLKVNQFIKKYGPWINLCLQTLSSVMGIMTSNVIPQAVSNILSSVFNIADNSDLMRYFQEIIDTVDIGVKTITDDEPNFIPLDDGNQSIPHKMINASGLHKLKKFLDTHESNDHFGGLVQYVDDETEEILWLCEEHKNEYCAKSKQVKPDLPSVDSSPKHILPEVEQSVGSTSPRNCPPQKPTIPPEPSSTLSTISSPISSPISSSTLSSSPLSSSPLSTPPSSSPSSPVDSKFFESSNTTWDCSKFDMKANQIHPLDPYLALEYVCKVLGEVIDNAMSSERLHFRTKDIKKIANKIGRHKVGFKFLCQRWNDNAQKVKFMSILKSQAYLYIHYLKMIDRYYSIVNDNSAVSLYATRVSLLCRDSIIIKSIIEAGELFNIRLGKLIATAEESQYDKGAIEIELDSFVKEPGLKVDDANSSVFLSRWYHTVDRTRVDAKFSSKETKETRRGILFDKTKRFLNKNTIVTGKSLKNSNYNHFLCIMKEIHLYDLLNDMNDNSSIIKFYGYSVENCKSTLFYDYADRGDLFKYFKESENLLKDSWKEKIKLAWEISKGVKYLHDKRIVHLDLRSENILLKYDKKGKALIPKLTNFIWSKSLLDDDNTLVYPKINISPEDKIWKRWHDPDRLYRIKSFEYLRLPSDIYSLGLLFWEIAWCEPDNLPFKDILIKDLYNHLRNKHYEELPEEIPEEWMHLISKMWRFNQKNRSTIVDVESTMQELSERKNN